MHDGVESGNKSDLTNKLSTEEVNNVRQYGLVIWIVLLGILLIGCGDKDIESNEAGGSTPQPGSQQQTEQPPAPQPKEVTVSIARSAGLFSDEEMDLYVIQPVREKYPHIQIKLVNFAEKGSSLTELVAVGDIPDIVIDGSLNLPTFLNLGLERDIEPLIQKHQFDLSPLLPEMVEGLREGTSRDTLIGLPIINQSFALFYNQNLFDRFAVDYPQDSMTWGEVRDIAARISRTDGDVHYYGWWIDNVFRGAYQMGLPWADWENNQSIFQTEPWKELFQFWYDLHRTVEPLPKGVDQNKEFSEGRLAMRVGSTTTVRQLVAVPEFEDWATVTYPTNPSAPGVGSRVDDFSMFITSRAAHPDEAFQVIAHTLSEEVQTIFSRQGRMAVLADRQVQDQFGADIPNTEHRNLVAFTKLKLASLHTFGNISAHRFINNAFHAVLYDGVDVNTALRQADEEMNQALKERLMMQQ